MTNVLPILLVMMGKGTSSSLFDCVSFAHILAFLGRAVNARHRISERRANSSFASFARLFAWPFFRLAAAGRASPGAWHLQTVPLPLFRIVRRDGNVRRVLTRRFPYRIFFSVVGETLYVHAVLHGARHD